MSTVHVLPRGDLVEHTVPGGWDGHDPDDPSAGAWLALEADDTALDEGCVCVPTPDLVVNVDGPDGWVVTHHALDGREHLEEARR